MAYMPADDVPLIVTAPHVRGQAMMPRGAAVSPDEAAEHNGEREHHDKAKLPRHQRPPRSGFGQP
jgi:hypothetical protein